MLLAEGALDATADGLGVCIALAEVVEGEGGAGEGGSVPFSTNQVCSGVNKGGEQAVFLKNPSLSRVKHWFPCPTPLFTASRTRGKPMPPVRLEVELKKNC